MQTRSPHTALLSPKRGIRPAESPVCRLHRTGLSRGRAAAGTGIRVKRTVSKAIMTRVSAWAFRKDPVRQYRAPGRHLCLTLWPT
jgi:hypothetical protein